MTKREKEIRYLEEISKQIDDKIDKIKKRNLTDLEIIEKHGKAKEMYHEAIAEGKPSTEELIKYNAYGRIMRERRIGDYQNSF